MFLVFQFTAAQDDCPGIRLTSGLEPLLGNIPLVTDSQDLPSLPSLASPDCLPPLPLLTSPNCFPPLPSLSGCPQTNYLPPLPSYSSSDCFPGFAPLPELPCASESPCPSEFPSYGCGLEKAPCLKKLSCLCKPQCACKPICKCKQTQLSYKPTILPPAFSPYPYQSKNCACQAKCGGCKQKLATCGKSLLAKKLLPLLLSKGLTLGIGPDAGCEGDLSTLPCGLTSLVSNVARQPLYDEYDC